MGVMANAIKHEQLIYKWDTDYEFLKTNFWLNWSRLKSANLSG